LVCPSENKSLLGGFGENIQEEQDTLVEAKVEVDEHFDDSENVTVLEESLEEEAPVNEESSASLTVPDIKPETSLEEEFSPEPPISQIFIEDLNIQRETDFNSDEDTSSDHANYGDEDEVEIESEFEFDERSTTLVKGPLAKSTPQKWLTNVTQPEDQIKEPPVQDDCLRSSGSAEKDEPQTRSHQPHERQSEESNSREEQPLAPYFDSLSGMARRPKKIDFFGRGGNTRLSSEESLRSRKREYPNFDQVQEPSVTVSPSSSGDIAPTLIEKADPHIYPLKKRHRVLNSQSDEGESSETSVAQPFMNEGTSGFDARTNLSTARAKKRPASASSEDTTPTKRSKTPPKIQPGQKHHPQQLVDDKELQTASLGIPEERVPDAHQMGQTGATRNDPHQQTTGSFINLSEIFPKDEFDLAGWQSRHHRRK